MNIIKTVEIGDRRYGLGDDAQVYYQPIKGTGKNWLTATDHLKFSFMQQIVREFENLVPFL
jgi:hypothetical protein